MKLQELKRLVANARQASTFARAGFGQVYPDPMPPNPTDYIRDQTKLYRDTWIIDSLDQALYLIEQEITRQRGDKK